MEKSDIYTGTIVYMDSQMKAGYITRDADGARVYFDFSDVIRDVGLGTARENHMVQFVQAQDSDGKLVAKYVTVMPSRRAAK